jgi:Flp pilus assembly protein TadB
MHHSHSHADQPALITSAPESADAEFDRRRKRYAVMMGLRALCVIGAAVTYQVSMVLALVFVLGGIVLPWCAVIIANDRPAKKRGQRVMPPGVPVERALPPGRDERTVDG